ncbi:MAG: TonB-dependent receptor [Melioribacteraceae bacterium]|nr:TonB-dependent receptor [Melioribacteraceae bacterium]
MKLLQSDYKKFTIVLFILVLCSVSYGQTGKISGNVKDAKTGEPLIQANVFIEGTHYGAATDFEGDFSIINVPPGKYNLLVRMLGFATFVMKDINVSVNRTLTIDVEMNEANIELGEEVVVIADKVSMKKDQTSSIRNVNTDQIKALPVENLTDVVNMQSGVVAGHFRGGRASEVSYMIDGMIVDDSFNKERRNVNVETDVIQEVEVITGTFNAEYGSAMSGIVNAVTKDGQNTFEGSVSGSASNYLTSNDDIFIGIDEGNIHRNVDYKAYLSGPIVKNLLSFVVNGRYQDRKNHLSGIDMFRESDYSRFREAEETWHSEKSGTGDFVSMNTEENYSVYTKLAFKPFVGMRSSFTFTRNWSENGSYSHNWKYNPNGLGKSFSESDMFALQINHSLNNEMFYEFKASMVENDRGYHLYDSPTDSRYVSDKYRRSDPGFVTGGQDKGWWESTTKDYLGKLDFTWMIHKNHVIKTGLSFTQHDYDSYSVSIRNKYETTGQDNIMIYDSTGGYLFPYYEPMVLSDSTFYASKINAKPIEAAWYIQDKMEYDDMVINFGARLDYFDPNTKYPTDWRNPANQIRFDDPNSSKYSDYVDADTYLQVSPRLGLSYQLGDAALLRFAYGHFYQMPPLSYLYSNPMFMVSPIDLETKMGNPTLKPQKTVQYEIGLWQQIVEGMSVEVAVYYRDIYDLLGTKILYTYNQIRYGLYTNLDYGNVKGLEIKYDYVIDNFAFYMNYTLQYTRGNADQPDQTFDRAGGNLDPVNELFRMGWDQRHTINASVSYSAPVYGATVTAYYNSGTPYTWDPLIESTLSKINLDYNNSDRPSKFQVDLRAFYNIYTSDLFDVKLNLLVYNLFDSLLEEAVYSNSGKAYQRIVRETEVQAHKSDFNDYYDAIKNPAMYAPPREVKLGIDISF